MSEKMSNQTKAVIFLSTASLAMLIGIILLIIKDTLNCTHPICPEPGIAIVLYDNGRGRCSYQIAAIERFMKGLYKKIYVFYTGATAPSVKAITIHTTESMEKNFISCAISITEEDRFVYMGDQVVPQQPITMCDFVSYSTESKLKLFNYVEDDVRSVGLASSFEEAMPTMICTVKDHIKFLKIEDFIMNVITSSSALYSPDVNQIIYITGNEYVDEKGIVVQPNINQRFLSILTSSPVVPSENALILKRFRANAEG